MVPLDAPRITKRGAALVAVTLDNGEVLRCTPDHLFRLRDGSYRRADALKGGDSLMPLYRDLSRKDRGHSIDGYERVFLNSTGRWQYTHHLADAWNLSQGLDNQGNGPVRHHVDFNKRNNDPRNLVRMTKEGHWEYHQSLISHPRVEAGYRAWLAAGGREVMSQRMKEQWQDPTTAPSWTANNVRNGRDAAAIAARAAGFQTWWEGLSDDDRAAYCEEMRQRQAEYWADPEARQAARERVLAFFADPARRVEWSRMAREEWADPQLRAWRSAETRRFFEDPAQRERQRQAVLAWRERSPEWVAADTARRQPGGDIYVAVRAGNAAYFANEAAADHGRKTADGRRMAALRRLAPFTHLDDDGMRAAYEQVRKQEATRGALTFETLMSRFDSIDALRDAASKLNHKVVRVEPLTETEDVYDLTVDTYHNFALEAGVFVHNSAKKGRSSQYQAILPLRGKVLNVAKASLGEALKNAEIASVVQVIGAGSGRTFDVDAMRYQRIFLMSVLPAEPVMVREADGTIRVASISEIVDPLVDGGSMRVSADGDTRVALTTDLSTASLGVSDGASYWGGVREAIRHHYSDDVYEVCTAYGRSVTVTGGHSLYTVNDDGSIGLKPACELQIGDIIAAPRRLPRAQDPVTVLNVARTLRDTGQEAGVRLFGPAIARWAELRSAREMAPAEALAKFEERVMLSTELRATLIDARKAMGLTLRQVAQAVGVKQACTISEWETGRGNPTVSRLAAYLTTVGVTVSVDDLDGATRVGSIFARLRDSTPNSKHARYSRLSADCWLRDLTDGDLAWLAAQPDAHGVSVYVEKRRHLTLPLLLPVDESLGLILGWYTAEGSLDAHGRVRFAMGADDEPYREDLERAIKAVTGSTPVWDDALPGRANSREMRFGHAPFRRLLDALGATGTAATKRVPSLMFSSTPDVQFAFLRGLYLGDGAKGSTRDKIQIVASNKHLMNDVCYLWGQLGIAASTTARVAATSTTRDGHVIRSKEAWSVTVLGKEQIRAAEPVWASATNAAHLHEYATTGFSRTRHVQVSEDYIGLPVRAITVRPYDGPVYDLSVPEDESFVTGWFGGLAAHNTDADVDGSHIRALLLTLMYRYMRPAIEAGRVYAAMPPLFQITTKGRNPETHLAYTSAEMEQIVARLERVGKQIATPIKRFKGLGEMNASELWDTTMNPATRTVRRITVADAAEAERVIELLMGDAVTPRKDWLISYADQIDRDAIDA